MTATIKDDWFPRSVMFLCLSAAFLLLGIHWRSSVAQSVNPSKTVSSTAPIKTAPAVDASGRKVDVSAHRVNTATVQKESSNLVVDLSDRRVYVYRDKQLLASYPVAVGQDGWETPTGSFQVRHMESDPSWLHPITKEVFGPGSDNPLGRRWIGFWFDGQTEIGFHGTNQEELIGQAVSHGCLRMRNQDVEALYAQVSNGTSVVVRP